MAAPPEAGAPPAKRDTKWDNVAYIQYEDGSYETKGSNGKHYTPVEEYEDERKTKGRRLNYLSTGATNVARHTRTNVMPGFKNLNRVSKGLMENKDTNYIDDVEKRLFEHKRDILNLIKGLEKKNEDEA